MKRQIKIFGYFTVGEVVLWGLSQLWLSNDSTESNVIKQKDNINFQLTISHWKRFKFIGEKKI